MDDSNERQKWAQGWIWNNLLNGSNDLKNPNPYGNGSAMKYNWY